MRRLILAVAVVLAFSVAASAQNAEQRRAAFDTFQALRAPTPRPGQGATNIRRAQWKVYLFETAGANAGAGRRLIIDRRRRR